MTVAANALTIDGGAQIASSTAGPSKGGDIAVTVAKGVTLSGVGPRGASGISTSAQPGSSGDAGIVVLTAGGAIALSGGAEVTSTTAGAGNGGTVQVTAQGPLTLADVGTGIITSTEPGSSGNAGYLHRRKSQSTTKPLRADVPLPISHSRSFDHRLRARAPLTGIRGFMTQAQEHEVLAIAER